MVFFFFFFPGKSLPDLEFFLCFKSDGFHLELSVLFSKIKYHISLVRGKFSECSSLHITLQYPRSYIIGVVCVHPKGRLMLIY